MAFFIRHRIKLSRSIPTLVFMLILIISTHFLETNSQDDEDELRPKKTKKSDASKIKKPKKQSTETMVKEAKKEPEKKTITAVAQESAKGEMTAEEAEDLTGKQYHNWCGCGNGTCEQFAKCKKTGYEPLCCENKCKCVKTTKQELESYWKTLKRNVACRILECSAEGNNEIVKKKASGDEKGCYDVGANEFNCWTHYDKEKTPENNGDNAPEKFDPFENQIKPTTQFAYFGCGAQT